MEMCDRAGLNPGPLGSGNKLEDPPWFDYKTHVI
jgi:hypothetical protein